MCELKAILRWALRAAWGYRANDELASSKSDERTRRYNRERNRLTLLGLILDLALGTVLTFSGVGRRLQTAAEKRASNRLFSRSLAILGFGVIQSVIGLPLGYYRGYTLEHRYDLSNQSRRAWIIDQLKGAAIAIPLGLLILNGVYRIIDRWPRRWWAILGALALPFTALLSQLAPVLIAPLFNRYEPLRDPALAESLKSLATRSGVRVADVLQMDMSRQTKKANAFFAGLGRTKRIVLADTLLDTFDANEIEVVVAHEIAHQAHRDIWRLIGLGAVGTLVSSWAVDRLARGIMRRAPERVGASRLAEIASLPLLAWLLSLIGLALGPLQNAYSRWIERRADQFALELTRDPAGFGRAMTRLGEQNLADPNPSRLVKYALYSHPPLGERLAHGRRFARQHGLEAS
jgi:STE24 endopeptidase